MKIVILAALVFLCGCGLNQPKEDNCELAEKVLGVSTQQIKDYTACMQKGLENNSKFKTTTKENQTLFFANLAVCRHISPSMFAKDIRLMSYMVHGPKDSTPFSILYENAMISEDNATIPTK